MNADNTDALTFLNLTHRNTEISTLTPPLSVSSVSSVSLNTDPHPCYPR